ncbi:hypothetical protein [Streptomyces sp. NBC_00687]|uniref:effector-associated constant component EACC1 n=1 Tax=Streptomyces sp. NBC_00687 TaxID=2975807 RepID=UPI00338E157B
MVSDSVEHDARSLYEWLLLDRAIRRDGLLTMASSSFPVPGQQGSVIDLVSLVLGSGISAASLGVSVASWRTTRPQPPTMCIERADGTRVTITGTSQAEAQRLIEQLLGDQQ